MKLHLPLLLSIAWASLGIAACAREVSPPFELNGVPAASDEAPGDPTMLEPEIGTPPEPIELLRLGATMTAREQVPAVHGSGETGTATFSLDALRSTLEYTVTHTVAAPTGAHLHLGIAGENGEVLLPLAVAPGVLSGTLRLTPEQASHIAQGRVYVDIHSADHPDGVIRGQVVLPGEIVYVARLTADQVSDSTASSGEGLGAFLVDGTTNRMRFELRARGMVGAPTRALVGMGPAGVEGPVVLDLTDPKTPAAVRLAGARTIDSSEPLDLGRWYVALHSRSFPMGELRGQILRPGQELYLARMSGQESVPPVSTQARGSVAVIVDSDRSRIIYDVALSNMTATEAHLGEGSVGVRGAVTLPFQVIGSSFRSMRMLTQDSTLLTSLSAGNIFASAASESFPEGEIRGQMRRVGLPR
jgi:hypothetical protein